MTHREYQKCADYYDQNKENSPPVPKRETKPTVDGDKLFYPDIKPVSQAEMMKLIWAGRLKITEKI